MKTEKPLPGITEATEYYFNLNGREWGYIKADSIQDAKEKVKQEYGQYPVHVERKHQQIEAYAAQISKDVHEGSSIYNDTPIIPEVVADTVAVKENISSTERQQFVAAAVKRAEAIYQTNSYFKQKVQSRGNMGRDYLYTIFTHWADVWKRGGKAARAMQV